jgi:hypothetical protein
MVTTASAPNAMFARASQREGKTHADAAFVHTYSFSEAFRVAPAVTLCYR